MLVELFGRKFDVARPLALAARRLGWRGSALSAGGGNGQGSRSAQADHQREFTHWNEVARQARSGDRLFWLNHPRVAKHYHDKSLVDGLRWLEWIPKTLGRPARLALDLGCGTGRAAAGVWGAGAASALVGIDLDDSRFESAEELLAAAGGDIKLVATDINHLRLEESSYDLIYAIQSFHHFENLEHILAEVRKALTPGGFFVLDEYVGPARFQWTNEQLALTSQLLGLMPRHLRMYRHGIEKLQEGRSTVAEVINVCPSEAIRSDEIVPLFYKHFQVVRHQNLGGTIQHLLYSGIIQNFPDDDPAIDHLIDCVDGLERVFIERGILPSDFVLLIGRKS